MTQKISVIGMSLRLGMVTLLTTGGLSAVSSVARADADRARDEKPQQTVTPKVGKALKAAQELLQKQDWDGAWVKIQEAQAVKDRSAFDDFQIAEMLGYTELKRQRYPEASAAFEQSLASGMLPATETTNRLKLVAQLALQLKDYPKAAQFATKAIESAADPEPELYALLGQGQYLARDYKAAADAMAHAVESARKAGKPVAENWLQVQLSSYAQEKDAAGVLSAFQQLAIAFPNKKYLMDLFTQWKRQPGDDRAVLNLYRLMFELGLLEEAEDYLKMAQLAVEAGVPGEAVRALEQGKSNKVFTDEVDAEYARRKLETAQAAAVADRKTLQALEQQERSGEEEVQLGVALVSYEEYAKAVEALQRGLAKGGIKQPDQAQILLGQALLKLNRPADATTAFASVDPAAKLKTIAELWRVYTAQPSPLA